MGELIAAAGGGQITARFVRFLVSEGVIPPPTGGRAHAVYDERHLDGVMNYVRLRGIGLSAAQVKSMIRATQGKTVPLALAPGVSLHIDLAVIDPGIDPGLVGRLAAENLATLLGSITMEGQSHADAA
jgi:DNA-binding transcriptional MerR regulator